jgi:hypothetical protein
VQRRGGNPFLPSSDFLPNVAMEKSSGDWARTVFRLRGLPDTVDSLEGAAHTMHAQLDGISIASIRILSLATALTFGETLIPPSKVATLMFSSPPSLVLNRSDANEWAVDQDPDCDLVLDTHFMGMTPLNDVKDADHVAE